MNKVVLFFLSVLLYLVFLFIQLCLSIGLNMAVFGRGEGGITAIGSLLSIWTSYKLLQLIRSRVMTRKEKSTDVVKDAKHQDFQNKNAIEYRRGNFIKQLLLFSYIRHLGWRRLTFLISIVTSILLTFVAQANSWYLGFPIFILFIEVTLFFVIFFLGFTILAYIISWVVEGFQKQSH